MRCPFKHPVNNIIFRRKFQWVCIIFLPIIQKDPRKGGLCRLTNKYFGTELHYYININKSDLAVVVAVCVVKGDAYIG